MIRWPARRRPRIADDAVILDGLVRDSIARFSLAGSPLPSLRVSTESSGSGTDTYFTPTHGRGRDSGGRVETVTSISRHAHVDRYHVH